MTNERAEKKPKLDPIRDALAPRPLSDQKPPNPTGGTVSSPRRGGEDEETIPASPRKRVLRGG